MKQAELFNVKDHVAFVTGAASGLGLAYAEVMAENGAKVLMADHNAERLTFHTTRLNGMGCEVEPVLLDVADTDALRAAIDDAAARHHRLDALFANAGISGGRGTLVDPSGAIDQFDIEAYKRAIDVNMTSTLMAMRFAVPHMKRRRSGSIVATSSIAGIRAEPITGYSYIASKAASHQHRETGGGGTGTYIYSRQCDCCAGTFPDKHQRRWPSASRQGNCETICRYGARWAALAKTDEIKGLALLLASSAGSYITGTCILIDGGATAVMTRGSYSTAVAARRRDT